MSTAKVQTPSVQTVQRAIDFVAKEFAKTDGGRGVFLQDIYESAKVVEVFVDDDNCVVVKFNVHTVSKLTNSMQMVHGGASSSLIAMFSVLSLAADAKYWKDVNAPTEEELSFFVSDLGVTRSIDIQIIQAVPLNTDVTIKVHILSNTKSNSFLSGGIYSSAGKLLVSAIHDLMKRPPAPADRHHPHTLRSSFHPESKL